MLVGEIAGIGTNHVGGELPGQVQYGIQGPHGGYYTPSVSQPDPATVQFAFAPSNPNMPAVPPATITLPVPESGGNVGFGSENAGKLLYVGADGFATVLALGAGLAIENGVLILTGNSQGVLVTDDGNGNVTVTGVTVTDDGNGNVTVTGVTVTDDGNGNVSVA